jgi:MFS family permease
MNKSIDDRKVWEEEEDLEEMSFIFKTYKVRFFGLTLIGLANIASSINWLSVAPVPDYANTFFNNCGLTTINWFSNVFMVTYLVAGPLSSWVYDRWSIKAGVCIYCKKKLYLKWKLTCSLIDCHWCCFANSWCLVALLFYFYS